jgi:hypothetical protein
LLLPFAAAASAQAQTLRFETSVEVGATSSDALVARVMSFDLNNDGRITSDELNERMKPLLGKGDVNGDRALDGTEIRSLATAPAPRQVRGFPSAGGYGFGDDSGFSSRLHIEGALEDLRLSAATRERALPVVRDFLDTWEASSKATLLNDMEAVLTAEQLANFSQKLDTNRIPVIPVPELQSIATNVPPDQASRLEGLLARLADQMVLVSVAPYKLTDEQTSQARAALERFNSRRRLRDAERSVLLDRMAGILSNEERDDFRSALERRPVVKAGTGVMKVALASGSAFTAQPNVRMIGFGNELAAPAATGVAP